MPWDANDFFLHRMSPATQASLGLYTPKVEEPFPPPPVGGAKRPEKIKDAVLNQERSFREQPAKKDSEEGSGEKDDYGKSSI